MTTTTTARIFRITLEVGSLEQATSFYASLLDTPGTRHRGARHYFDCGGVILAVLDTTAGGAAPTTGAKSLYFAVADSRRSSRTRKRAGSSRKLRGPRRAGRRAAETPVGRALLLRDESVGQRALLLRGRHALHLSVNARCRRSATLDGSITSRTTTAREENARRAAESALIRGGTRRAHAARMLVLRRSAILALTLTTGAALATGCGSVVTGATDPATLTVHEASTSAQDACASSGAAICSRAQACSPFWFGQFYTSLATCSAVFTAKCLDRYVGAGAAPSVVDCSAKIGSLTCEELLDPVVVTTLDPAVMIASCPVTPGAFALGASCLRDGDCSTGHCAAAKGGACGTCDVPPVARALRKIGEECTDSSECASLTCSGSQCVENAKLGEPCAAGRSCDLLGGLTCGSDSKCRPFGVARVGHRARRATARPARRATSPRTRTTGRASHAPPPASASRAPRAAQPSSRARTEHARPRSNQAPHRVRRRQRQRRRPRRHRHRDCSESVATPRSVATLLALRKAARNAVVRRRRVRHAVRCARYAGVLVRARLQRVRAAVARLVRSQLTGLTGIRVDARLLVRVAVARERSALLPLRAERRPDVLLQLRLDGRVRRRARRRASDREDSDERRQVSHRRSA